ncbi:MAG: ester cyclase, partial [Planctomycetes bacterium]|nr:ester cyclase [Planctomycetota bacterium]
MLMAEVTGIDRLLPALHAHGLSYIYDAFDGDHLTHLGYQIASGLEFLSGALQSPEAANIAIAQRFFEEMWNLRRLDLVPELITADMAGHAPTGEFTGYDGETMTILGTLAAFPDLHITIDDIFAEGDKVGLRTSYSGTHTGPLMGQIPATGQSIRMTGNILFRFEEGKIAEAWSFADMLGLMQQIGVSTPGRPS